MGLLSRIRNLIAAGLPTWTHFSAALASGRFTIFFKSVLCFMHFLPLCIPKIIGKYRQKIYL